MTETIHVPVDAIDQQGRRYLEFPVHVRYVFASQVLNEAMAHVEQCIECGRDIHHGEDRYFQRNDLSDGAFADAAVARLAQLLILMTYDPVCGACGDAILARDST